MNNKRLEKNLIRNREVINQLLEDMMKMMKEYREEKDEVKKSYIWRRMESKIEIIYLTNN